MKTTDKELTLLEQREVKTSWREKAQWRRENRRWLRYSGFIALSVLKRLEEEGMSQKELAEKMNCSPQYISKLLKGSENLTLDTISKLEKTLGINLVESSLTLVDVYEPREYQIGYVAEPGLPKYGSKHSFTLSSKDASIEFDLLGGPKYDLDDLDFRVSSKLDREGRSVISRHVWGLGLGLIESFMSELKSLYNSLEGRASLSSFNGDNVVLDINGYGQITVKLEDGIQEGDGTVSICFCVDQTYLPDYISQIVSLCSLITKHPLTKRGNLRRAK